MKGELFFTPNRLPNGKHMPPSFNQFSNKKKSHTKIYYIIENEEKSLKLYRILSQSFTDKKYQFNRAHLNPKR
jgi:hypothetical protein